MTDHEPPYRVHTVAKDGGGTRDIYVASEQLSKRQRQLLHALNRAEIGKYMPYAHGGVKGRGPLTNAAAHIGAELLYKVDLFRAYDSVDNGYLKRIAAVALAYITEVDWPGLTDDTIDRYVTIPDVPGLPTGFSTSPMFFNIYCMEIDYSLGEFCAENGITYTRFVDDLTFSSEDDTLSRNALRRALRARVMSVPAVQINDRKVHLHTMEKGVTVTGITLTSDPEYMHPAKALLNKVDEFLGECEAVRAAGMSLTKHDLNRLHGYNGVLNMAGPAAESRSRYVQELYDRYRRLAVWCKLSPE